jgi:hypothetical protein
MSLISRSCSRIASSSALGASRPRMTFSSQPTAAVSCRTRFAETHSGSYWTRRALRRTPAPGRRYGLPGDSQLRGNYQLGAWYDDARLANFQSGAKTRGSWGFYGLFDQVLVPLGSPGSNRGFGVFGSVTVAPDSDIQQQPLFLTAGVSARGIFDARPRDVVGLAAASSYFGKELRRAQKNGQLPGPAGGGQHLRDGHRTDLSLRLPQERVFHPARPSVHHSARRHAPSRQRVGARCPVRNQLLSDPQEDVMAEC